MELKITTFYCLCDDFLISEGWFDDLSFDCRRVLLRQSKLQISQGAWVYACHAFKKPVQPPPEQHPRISLARPDKIACHAVS